MASTSIMVVEDEGIVARSIENRLLRFGYSVPATTASGEKAVLLAEDTRPDLVLMDIKLQGDMDGVEAADYIQAHFDIPVVYLTAYADDATLQRARITEPYGYLVKPFEALELRSTIEMALYKHAMNKKLRQSEARYRSLFNSVPTGLNRVTLQGEILDANQTLVHMLAFPNRQSLLETNFNDLYVDPQACTLWQTRLKADGIVQGFEVQFHRLDGATIWVELNSRAIRKKNGKITYCEGTLQDITERVQAQEERSKLFTQVRASQEQLRDLTGYLQNAREKERAYIAREIHDEFGQALTALKIDLSWLSKHLPEDEPRLVSKMNSMLNLVDDTINMVRRIATALRPGLLDDLGLTAAIEWQVQEFAERTGIECDIHLGDEDIQLDRDLATDIFRIFQETLTNVARHAEASKVRVDLIEEQDELILIVHDNGKGITESRIKDNHSLGLAGMRERVRPLYGEVTFEGVPGEGTKVTVRVPREGGRGRG